MNLPLRSFVLAYTLTFLSGAMNSPVYAKSANLVSDRSDDTMFWRAVAKHYWRLDLEREDLKLLTDLAKAGFRARLLFEVSTAKETCFAWTRDAFIDFAGRRPSLAEWGFWLQNCQFIDFHVAPTIIGSYFPQKKVHFSADQEALKSYLFPYVHRDNRFTEHDKSFRSTGALESGSSAQSLMQFSFQSGSASVWRDYTMQILQEKIAVPDAEFCGRGNKLLRALLHRISLKYGGDQSMNSENFLRYLHKRDQLFAKVRQKMLHGPNKGRTLMSAPTLDPIRPPVGYYCPSAMELDGKIDFKDRYFGRTIEFQVKIDEKNGKKPGRGFYQYYNNIFDRKPIRSLPMQETKKFIDQISEQNQVEKDAQGGGL